MFGFTNGTQLVFYDSIKRNLSSNLSVEQLGAVPLFATLSTAVWTALLAHPLDVILVRVVHPNNQHGQAWYKGPVDAAVKTVATDGVSGLCKGFSATFLRQLPHTVVTFTMLDVLRESSSFHGSS